jgi:hypothetical protein
MKVIPETCIVRTIRYIRLCYDKEAIVISAINLHDTEVVIGITLVLLKTTIKYPQQSFLNI